MLKHSRTTLYLLNEFQDNICKVEIDNENEQITFVKERDDEILKHLTCSKKNAIKLLNQIIGWIKEES